MAALLHCSAAGIDGELLISGSRARPMRSVRNSYVRDWRNQSLGSELDAQERGSLIGG
jgi:hypothetical protein